jgi:hypothetical protein
LSFFFVAINGSSQLLDKTDEVFGTQVSLDMLPMAFLGKFWDVRLELFRRLEGVVFWGEFFFIVE